MPGPLVLVDECRPLAISGLPLISIELEEVTAPVVLAFSGKRKLIKTKYWLLSRVNRKVHFPNSTSI